MDTKKPKKSKKTSIPTTTSKSSSKSKKNEKEKPVKKSKPKVEKVPSPQPIDEYADDFEPYESDFEDDVSEIKPASRSPEQKNEVHLEEVVESEEDEPPKISDSILLNRVNQVRFESPPTNRMSTATISTNDARPTTSAKRVFTFEQRSMPNTETLMLSANVFTKLKSGGYLSYHFIQSVDVAPNRITEIYNNLIENTLNCQRYTQTNDDSLDNYSQTTPREFTDKANQFPSIFIKNNKAINTKPSKHFRNAERLLKFVGISGRTFLSLLGSGREVESVHLPLRSNVEFSAGFASFSVEKMAKKYKSIGVEITDTSEPRILVGFYIEESDNIRLTDKSILLEYALDDLEHQIGTYLTSDEITDFSYSKSLIFAGQRSGNCLLWDLLNKNSTQLPAYSTAYIMTERRKHAFVHQSDQSIVQTGALNPSDAQQQFLSLNAGGTTTIWAVTRDQLVTTNDDLGLDFSSVVRLMKISSNVCATISGFGCAPKVALCLDTSGNDFIVGMSQGGVVRVCRGSQTDQRLRRYNLNSNLIVDYGQSKLSANSVCFCPHDSTYFAVGTSAGTLLIFKTTSPNPIMEMQLKESRSYRVNQLTNLVWSHNHTQILFALYDYKYFATWDLSANIEPEIVDLKQKLDSNIVRMLSWNLTNNVEYIAFTLSSGSILVHELHRLSIVNTSLKKLFNGE